MHEGQTGGPVCSRIIYSHTGNKYNGDFARCSEPFRGTGSKYAALPSGPQRCCFENCCILSVRPVFEIGKPRGKVKFKGNIWTRVISGHIEVKRSKQKVSGNKNVKKCFA